MSETEAEELAILLLLRGYELRLLRCTLPPSPSPSPSPSPPSVHLHSLISNLLASAEAGRYLDALASPAASRLVFGLDHSAPPPPIEDSAECADRLYSSLISNLLASAEAGRYLDALASPAASRLVFGLDHSAPPPPIEDSAECADRLYSSLISNLLASAEAGRYLDALASPAASRLVFGLDHSAPPPPIEDSAECADRLYSSLISNLLASAEAGRYLDALASPAASRLVFGLDHSAPPPPIEDSAECADRLYSEFLGRAELFLGGEDDGEKGLRVVVVMCIAVAAFLGFVQCNMIGPLEGLPKCPLPLGGDEFGEWDNWARNQLMSSGSDLLGKFSNLQVRSPVAYGSGGG